MENFQQLNQAMHVMSIIIIAVNSTAHNFLNYYYFTHFYKQLPTYIFCGDLLSNCPLPNNTKHAAVKPTSFVSFEQTESILICQDYFKLGYFLKPNHTMCGRVIFTLA